jgi:hypothetical protein
MNKKTVLLIIIGIVVLVGVVSLIMNNQGSATSPAPVQTVTTPGTSTTAASSSVPLMQSTTQLFSQYQYFSKAHEIFPTLAADTVKTMGAFSFTKEDLGGNVYRFTLTNSNEGYQGQSVVVSGDQSVYFIERSSGDDSDTEDSSTQDDFLVAVDAQGYILQ